MAYTAVADDIYAIHFNPAGLARQDKHQVTASYVRYFQDVHYGFIGMAPAAQSWGAVGLGVAYLTLDGIEGRKGDTEAADRSFGATDAAFTATYARRDVGGASFPGLSVGGSAKLITQMLDGSRGVTGAFDIGALYDTKAEGLTLGLAVRNIGPGVKYLAVRDPLPM
ncbi:MAG: PorV/PorQ family protein, partial [bacterium]